MKLRPPSPALAVSITAVVIACTGSAVAATVITSKQIRNGTIQGVDIKKETITSSKLSKGTQNLLGRRGAAPAAGGHIVYEALRKAGPEGQPPNVVVKVASLTVPAGAYKVTAKTVMTSLVPAQGILEALALDPIAVGGRCKLDAAGVGDESLTNVVVNARQTPATLTMQLTRTIGAASEIFMECSSGLPWRLSETSIVAQKVDEIKLTEIK